MIEITNAEVFGWEVAIRGMRNPKNSWEKSDSGWTKDVENQKNAPVRMNGVYGFFIGDNDIGLMQTLSNAGTDHSKCLRMINVSCDIKAPLYWWKEYDTYKVGTVANSCSTMHKIQEKEFVMDDFSHEHLMTGSMFQLHRVVDLLNEAREAFLETKDKAYWWQMIQLLPSSYNQLRTVQLNYQVLKNMYHARKNHKLDEWRTFCEWIEALPYAKELSVGKEKKE